MTCDAPPESGCAYAKQAAKDAVRETFIVFGVNIDNADSVEAFREDLRFNKRVRKLSDKVSMLIITAVVVTTVGATLGAVWLGVATKIKGGP